MRQTHESPQPKSTAVEQIVTQQPQQTVVTRSGRTSVRPTRYGDFKILTFVEFTALKKTKC